MSQIGDFMVVVTPCGGFSATLFIGLYLRILLMTLAHHGLGCQAGFHCSILRRDADPGSYVIIRESG
jgi:hypothetical protein